MRYGYFWINERGLGVWTRCVVVGGESENGTGATPEVGGHFRKAAVFQQSAIRLGSSVIWSRIAFARPSVRRFDWTGVAQRPCPKRGRRAVAATGSPLEQLASNRAVLQRLRTPMHGGPQRTGQGTASVAGSAESCHLRARRAART